MITSMRRCVTCDDLWPWPISSRSIDLDKIWKFEFLANFWNFSALTLKKNLQFSMDSFHIYHKWSLVWEGVLNMITFDLDLYLQDHLVLTLKIVSAMWHLQFQMDSFHIWYKWSLAWGVSHVMTFDLDFENRVHSVTFSVLDRIFPYLPQIITTIRGCVAY